jgi:transcriptional regulator
MYIPADFARADTNEYHRILDEYPFGVLIAGSNPPEVAHLPFILDRSKGEKGTLLFHVARPNPVRERLETGEPVLAVFSGPDGYVSAGWYEQPSRQVPTWNYIAMHVHGRPRPATRMELTGLLSALAARHEPAAGSRWEPSQLDPVLFENLLQGIAGFVLPIDRMEGKFKLSQNRSAADRARVRTGLLRRGSDEDVSLTEWMALVEEPGG